MQHFQWYFQKRLFWIMERLLKCGVHRLEMRNLQFSVIRSQCVALVYSAKPSIRVRNYFFTFTCLLTVFEHIKVPESHSYHFDILYGTWLSNIAGYVKLLPLTHKLFFINIQALETKYKTPLISKLHCRKNVTLTRALFYSKLFYTMDKSVTKNAYIKITNRDMFVH